MNQRMLEVDSDGEGTAKLEEEMLKEKTMSALLTLETGTDAMLELALHL